MLKDKLLIRRMKLGDADALHMLYEKYKDDLLTVSASLLHNFSAAEDVLHDVFITFTQQIDRFELRGSLKGYLLKCVVNRSRDIARSKRPGHLDDGLAAQLISHLPGPEKRAIAAEQMQILMNALAELPYEQREVIVLHLQAGLKFGRVAEVQGVSINTIQSRYRYGIEKLKQLLKTEVKNGTF